MEDTYLTANSHGHEDHGAIEAPLWLWRKPQSSYGENPNDKSKE